jgi:hypothetical protein
VILKLKGILSNPFRDLKANPLIAEKVDELEGSINLTGFWDNVVVRKNSDGKYELAYGHHRLAAAIKAGLEEADFIVKKLDDAMMIQIMDNENRETYGSSPQSIIESVRAVVQSLAKGNIPVFVISKDTPKTHIRYAPSFVPGVPSASGAERPYTALSISVFLGREKRDGKEANKGIVAALDALYLKERGRFNDALLVTQDRTGAKVPITTRELQRITADIKREVETVDKRTETAKKEAERLDAEQRKIQAEQKAAEQKAEVAKQKLVQQIVDAKKEEDDKQAELLKKRLAEAKAAEKEDAVLFKLRQFELNEKVKERKQQESEARKEDEYLPIRREVERILHKLEGSTATGREALAEEVKALARMKLNTPDRERLRQAALVMGTWYSEWVAVQFLPPLSVKKAMSEYRSREETKRRAQEEKDAKAQAKKEKRK